MNNNFNLSFYLLFLLFTLSVHAQKVSYSEPRGNFDQTKFNIIGKVKDHIIVWEYFRHNYSTSGWEYFQDDYSTSKILVYDNDLKLLNKVSVKLSGQFPSVDFLNEKDSFDLIYQYVSGNKFFCKRMSFDENGKNTATQTLNECSFSVEQPEKNNCFYKVIQSPDRENFILVKSQVTDALNKSRLSYILFADNKTRFDHTTDVPYTIDSATSYIFSLDNDNHFLVIASEGLEDNKLTLYEINPGTGDIAGMEGTVQEGFLKMKSLNTSNINNQVFITAQWQNKTNGIFVWQPDLYNFSKGKDTIYTEGIDTNFVLNDNEVLKTDVYFFNNTYKFFISVRQERFYNYDFYGNQNFQSGYNPEYNHSSGSSVSSTPLPNQPSKGMVMGYDNSSINRGDANPMLRNQQQSHSPARKYFSSSLFPLNRLMIYSVDEEHGLHSQLYLDSTIENDFISYLDYYNVFYSNQLQLIYHKIDKNHISLMSSLKINNQEAFSIAPVIVMKTSYKYFFGRGKKLSDNTAIYPCSVREQTCIY